MAALDRELATYQAKLPELMRTHSGKFVVIKEDRIEGILESYTDALKLAYEKHPGGGFLVKRIAPAEQIANFTRDLVITCQA